MLVNNARDVSLLTKRCAVIAGQPIRSGGQPCRGHWSDVSHQAIPSGLTHRVLAALRAGVDRSEASESASELHHSGDKVPYIVTALRSAIDAARAGTGVYVLKDAGGTVLYVGEGEALERLRRHVADAKKTPWFAEVDEVELRAAGLTKKQSLALEEDLIQLLSPLYNEVLQPFESAFSGAAPGARSAAAAADPAFPRHVRRVNEGPGRSQGTLDRSLRICPVWLWVGTAGTGAGR